MNINQIMMHSDDIWVLEWSNQQRCFHRSSLSESLGNNIENMIENRGVDYQVVAIGTYEQISDASEKFRQIVYKETGGVKIFKTIDGMEYYL